MPSLDLALSAAKGPWAGYLLLSLPVWIRENKVCTVKKTKGYMNERESFINC